MTDIISRDFIDSLLAKIDLVDLINAQVPLRKKSGSNYFARCPFHNEKSASFSVSQTKQFYYCFGCGAHGNAIDFVIQLDRLTFPEAIETLARQVGLEIPRTHSPAKQHESHANLYDLMIKINAYYYEEMCHSSRAIDYLKNRNISGHIAKQFHLGYAPTGWSHLLDRFGQSDIDRKKLMDAGLIIKKNEGGYYDRFRDRIIFPIHDYRGRIIGFGGRIIDQGEPKYLNSPETPIFQKGHELYGLHQAIKTNQHLERILIVEGYMDVIALFEHGITYAVATMGTATTPHQFKRLTRYTDEIIFCFDGDQAGRTAAWRALQTAFPIMQDTWQIRFLFLPDGEDPDTLIRKESKAQFEERIKQASSLSIFFFHTLSAQNDLQTMEGRASFAAAALNHIKTLPPGLFQSILVEELAKRARIDIQEIKQQIKMKEPIQASDLTKQPAPKVPLKLAPSLQKALALLIQYPSLVWTIDKADLEHLPVTSPLPGIPFLMRLIDMIQSNPNLTTGALLEYWRDHPQQTLIVSLAQWEHLIPETGLKKEFLGVIRQVSILGINHEIDRLMAKAALEGLTEAEKILLTESISKKKHLANPSLQS